jgi:hypothetical protein
MVNRTLFIGIGIWVGGTIVIRIAGQHLLHPADLPRSLALYAVSFVLMALLVPRILIGPRIERLAATTLLVLPTLVFDAFSSLFFARVFPNVEAAAAGVFGGWMLICCAGGVVGVWARR